MLWQQILPVATIFLFYQTINLTLPPIILQIPDGEAPEQSQVQARRSLDASTPSAWMTPTMAPASPAAAAATAASGSARRIVSGMCIYKIIGDNTDNILFILA